MDARENAWQPLERAWIHQLAWEWDEVNEARLKGVLKRPVFRITRGRVRLGHWEARSRTLAISADHIWEDLWADVVATLTHEMAHQVVSELYRETGETAHGPAFQKACGRLGLFAFLNMGVGTGEVVVLHDSIGSGLSLFAEQADVELSDRPERLSPEAFIRLVSALP